MDFRIIDMEQDPRRDQYAYFRSLANPYVGVTVNVDVTALMEWTKAGHSRWWSMKIVRPPIRWRWITALTAIVNWRPTNP